MDKLLEEFIKDWRLKNNSKDAIYSSYHYDAMIEFACGLVIKDNNFINEKINVLTRLYL